MGSFNTIVGQPHFVDAHIGTIQPLYLLIVLLLNLEVCLRMSTYRAHLWSLLADVDVTTVRALPDHITVTREYQSALYVCE